MNKNHPVVLVTTTQGSFEIELFTENAPKTCENFLKLAEKGYYNGTSFHRVIPNFMIQGGDPKGNGTGGESIWGDTFEDEFHPTLKFDKEGILAMANRGPNTNGSQFFITTTATPWLTNKHTIFGKVVKGYDVIQKIESTGSSSGRTSISTQIQSITVLPAQE
ncbi:peptidylprolyl isomerase [Rhabdochlamydiaceae symbiont of Dictyostelium giganteum]|uniref:peptidylprolyl isomerase n=1 Tax=Rhabdochlamydiaceae symbiont of Dictyostelium giganteum TaxID=3342349 RepID=UPI00384A93E6